MKAFTNRITNGLAICAVLISVAITGCSEDEVVVNSTTYDLKVVDELGVSGTVTFTETSSDITTIVIDMNGGGSESHPAHIHVNAAVEGGTVALSLNPVVNGRSSTEVSMLDNNAAISYSQLINYDGYLNVHQSSSDLNTIIGQTDIGGNALTANSKVYQLPEFGVSGVSGTAKFAQRKNGTTLVTITLNGTIADGIHPAIIHIGSVATVGGGPAVKTLNPVVGTTGMSYSNLRTLNDGTPISYDNILVYDGYLAIHQSALIPEVVLCQGNIGSN
jgi:hypothetical protein